MARVIAWAQSGTCPSVIPRNTLLWFGLAASLAFVLLAMAVVTGRTLTIDLGLTLAVHSRATSALDVAMRLLTLLGAIPVVGAIVLVSGTVLIRNGRRWDALTLVVVMGVQGALDDILKLAFHRPRPMFFPYPPAVGFSFPSGHAMTTICLASVLIAFGWPRLTIHFRWITAILLAIVVFAVGVSRVYLGVHTPTDVLGGWLAGTAWLGVAPTLLPRLAIACGAALCDQSDPKGVAAGQS